jgi:hypothetical protein
MSAKRDRHVRSVSHELNGGKAAALPMNFGLLHHPNQSGV